MIFRKDKWTLRRIDDSQWQSLPGRDVNLQFSFLSSLLMFPGWWDSGDGIHDKCIPFGGSTSKQRKGAQTTSAFTLLQVPLIRGHQCNKVTCGVAFPEILQTYYIFFSYNWSHPNQYPFSPPPLTVYNISAHNIRNIIWKSLRTEVFIL